MSVSHKQKKVQKSKDNKAQQQEAMKVNKKVYIENAFPQVQPKEKEVKEPTKVTFKGKKSLRKLADKGADDDLFSAYKTIVKDDKNNTNDKLDEIF